MGNMKGIKDSKKIFIYLMEEEFRNKLLLTSLKDVWEELTKNGDIKISFKTFKDCVYSAKKRLGFDGKITEIEEVKKYENKNMLRVVDYHMKEMGLNTKILLKSTLPAFNELVDNGYINNNNENDYKYFKYCVCMARKKYNLPKNIKNLDFCGDVSLFHMCNGEDLEKKFDLTTNSGCNMANEYVGKIFDVRNFEENMNRAIVKFPEFHKFISSNVHIEITEELMDNFRHVSLYYKLKNSLSENNNDELKKYKIKYKFNMYYFWLMFNDGDEFKRVYENR